jgi:hypothetical protein
MASPPVVRSPTAQPNVVGPATIHPTSIQDFIKGLKLPLDKPLIQSPTRLRVSRVPVENLIPRHSDRLAAKSVYCDPQPEKQAKRVMLNKWRPSSSAPRSSPVTPDASIATHFHGTFQEPLSSSKHVAMQELFPMAGACRRQATTQTP